MPAKVELIPSLPGLSPVGGKPVIARFDGGQLSSDGGLLVLREVEQRIDVAGRLAACIADPRDPGRVVHGLDEIIRFRLLMIAAGYEEPRLLRRMLLIQRWRRTALMVCLFLAITALLVNALDPTFVQPSSFALVQSLLAFIVAVLVAVNFLTFRLRK